jgi:galactokinase
VNLIGEHTDYNGGYVLPFALAMGTYAVVRRREDGKARFASTNFGGLIEVELNNIKYDIAHDWANYPKGIAYFMKRDGHVISGFDVLFSGDIPNGAGLSSSASIELVTATALNELFSMGYGMVELVKLAQRAENEFCKVNCGIMDQFAIGMGKKNHAIYLHCDTLEFEQVPLNLGSYKIVIMNTNKQRKLNDSKYNERRAECEQAAKLMRVSNLSELKHEPRIQDAVLRKRARHVVSENARVVAAIDAMRENDLGKLGNLLTLSHKSLRDDYEVSCFELDTLADEAIKHPACVGARMIGAGFGGCAIALVTDSEIPHFVSTVSQAYESAIGYAPSMYVQESGDGAREITEVLA